MNTNSNVLGSGRRGDLVAAPSPRRIHAAVLTTDDADFANAYGLPSEIRAIHAIRGQLLLFGIFGNEGSDSSIVTHGNLSSSQITFCGANGAGSSSDAIVTSIASESLLSSKNKCVPQHAAKERIRFACAILRGVPFVTTRSLRGTDPQVTWDAPALRRQSMQ
jgi:hypothetical protein